MRFRRALDRKNVTEALSAAAELPHVGLSEALELCLLLRDKAPEKFPRAALRWHRRLCREVEVSLEEAQAMLAALALLNGPRKESAAFALAELLSRRGLERPCEALVAWAQSAMKFINLTVPSSAGRIGMNLRFLQRMGVPTPHALAAGAADDASETIMQIGLLLLAVPFVRVEVDTGQFGEGGPDTRLIVAIGIVLLGSAALILKVPRLRAKVLPPVRSALSSLWSVIRDRHKRLELFGGSIAAELLYSIALGATCRAYGVNLNLAQLVFVNMSAAILSGLVPVPGGIGAAEASLAAGMIAMGVD